MLDQMQAKSPETYRLMFNDRNGRWAQWIARRLQQPGVVFVAVGAGHLAGKDSVQHKLGALGIRTARGELTAHGRAILLARGAPPL